MSIQQEEITLKQFTTGTTFLYFSTHLKQALPDNPDLTPSIVQLNNLNIPVDVSTFDGVNLWKRNEDNIHVPLSNITSNYLTGHSFTVDESQVYSPERIEIIKNNFTQAITIALNTGSTTLTADGPVVDPNFPIQSHTDFVFTAIQEIDDFFVDIKLNRTFGTLDTLNIYNNLVNSFPTQEANTGVVFGRLMALQTIKDAEGNNIKIPLRNTPVGIFNASEDYPLSTSVTDNGDRLFLNLKESAKQSEYFNVESFDFDKNELLRSASQFTTVPDQYKYVTTTNDEGEFVLYDVPVGSQIAVFEVDLLKQGLTRDEIALNFFDFPPDADAILDQIPNFSFKQFPVNVVPAWGTIQTGYTELNVVINLDLRKWTTYFFPPVSLYGQRLEASVAQNAANALKVEVRDMTREGFPKTNIKLAEIPNDLDRVSNQQLNWNLEFAQVKNKAEFYKFGVPIIKLPANIYDPDGFKTDSNGVPTNFKGVWLSSYQLKLSVAGGHNRKTGSIYAWNGTAMYQKSHFDINFSPNVPDTDPFPAPELGDGFFPYEKPWSKDYPDQYKIPAKPTDIRYQYEADRTVSSSPGIYYLDEPAYNDGDLIGFEVGGPGSGFGGGLGSQSAFGKWFHNRIAESVTKNFMYKYENGVAWNEEYANGYQPNNSSVRFAGVSKVLNGEKYQRFESGYGYFLRPNGWPRTQRALWGADTYFSPDTTHNNTNPSNGLRGNPENPGPGTTTSIVSGDLWASYDHQNDVYNLNNIELALALDSSGLIPNGTLEAYRVIDSNPDNLEQPNQFVLPTSVKLACSASAERLYSLVIYNTGDAKAIIPMAFYLGVNTSNGPVSPGGTIELDPGQSITITNPADGGLYAPASVVAYTNHTLPGNKNFNPATNRYETASYKFRFAISGAVNGDNPKYVQFNATAKANPDQWYIKTSHVGGSNGRVSNGINTVFGGDPSEEIWSLPFQTNDSSYDV